jgi:DNA-binding CsgD family transcriptional regulator
MIPIAGRGVPVGAGLREPDPALPQVPRGRPLNLQFEDLANWLPWGVLVVDERLQILYASRQAMRSLASREGLSCRKGILYTERASVDRAVRDLVRLALSRAGGADQKCDVIGIPDKDGQLRYALRVISSTENEDAAVAVIAISDLVFRPGIRRDAVGRLFCLSVREAEFAELFAMGCRVQEIALLMNVAVNTARVHLRNVFQKTGCSSQVELARKFAMLP